MSTWTSHTPQLIFIVAYRTRDVRRLSFRSDTGHSFKQSRERTSLRPYLLAFFKFSSFLRSPGCVTLAVGMRSSSCKLSAFYDQILISYRFIIKPTF